MSEVRYTDQHEWIRLDGDEATVGITKYAAERTAVRYRTRRGLDVSVARVGVAFGHWEYDTGVRDTLSLPLQLLQIARDGGTARFRRGLPRSLFAQHHQSRSAAFQATL